MDENAEKVLACLPEDGSSISGGQVLDQFDISKSEFKKGKKWLRENGMVTVGRGRGGTISRVVGAEPPPEAKKLTRAEVMEIAREEKQAISRDQKMRNQIREVAKKAAEEKYPGAAIDVNRDIQVWNVDLGRCFVTIWDGKEGIVEDFYV